MVAACSPAERAEVLGEGVGRVQWQLRTNGTDLVPVTVFFPVDGDGAVKGAALPAVVQVQGGAVAPARYAWQAIELAKRGYVVAQPRHPSDLAFFAIDFGQLARSALIDPGAHGIDGSVLQGVVNGERIAVAGHSLGGVVSVKLALQGGFRAAVVQASFPDTADDAKLSALGMPTLSLAGQGDCQAKEQAVRDGWAKLPSPTALVVLEGVTHFQFTESDAEDVRRGCAPSTSLADAQRRIIDATEAFLSGALSGSPSVNEAQLRAIPGALVETR